MTTGPTERPAPAATPAPSPTPAATATTRATFDHTAGQAPPKIAPSGVVLNQTDANLTGCDSIGWPDDDPFHTVTFHIDAFSAEPVFAVSDSGIKLQVVWVTGFEGSATDNVVFAPTGEVAARDGEVVEIPVGAYPDVRGWPFCLSPKRIIVYLRQP